MSTGCPLNTESREARLPRAGAWAALVLMCVGGWTTAHAVPPGGELVRSYCSGCHHETAGRFERISDIRKTPEGWLMTLFRMRQVHGLVLEDGVRDALVRYLADTQGLAPSEAAAGRFALERRPNARDLDLGPELNVMCGRCHSLARVSLQRRDEAEWRKLAHTHVGQWASIEYSASGRDRPWFKIATESVPPQLAARYPLASAAWSEWQKRPAADLSGAWVVVGRVSGGQDFYGTARIERDAAGDYTASYDLTDADGIARSGGSKAIVYTGYEWRGRADVGGRSLREVYAASADGNRLAGRWFDAEHDEEGGEWLAVREDGAPRVLAVIPRSLRAGSSAAVTLVGVGLAGADGSHGAKASTLSFGEGVTVSDVKREAHVIHAQVNVADSAPAGLRAPSAGAPDSSQGQLAIYRQIDQIDVVPAYAIARVGGGRVAPVSAQFEAMASTRLPGGELLALGPVRADWASAPFDAEARRTEDEKFAGHFDQRGCFLPASAGPNPAREYSGDNVGNLTVLARADDGGRTVEGHGHLIVTVQRWNTPPIY